MGTNIVSAVLIHMIYFCVLGQQQVDWVKCGGILTAESGQLNSPEVNNNGTSPISIRCHWTIMSENRTIELQILHMNLDFYTDYWCPHTSLKVHGETRHSFTRVCGQRLPPIYRSLNRLVIQFSLTVQPLTKYPVGLGFQAAYMIRTKEIMECWIDEGQYYYTGTISETESGQVCDNWSLYEDGGRFIQVQYFPEESLEEAMNYCRNPTRDYVTVRRNRIWCYTRSHGIGWEYCANPSCIALSGCLDFLPSTQYRGNLSTTANGRKCQAWSSSWPHDHDFHTDSLFQVDGSLKAAENYCRDPSNKGRIWCFTTDPDVTWEFCNFHACSADCWNKELTDIYRGELSVTATGHTCQSWSSQRPHSHDYFVEDSEFPMDGSVDDASNYCRDPDVEGRSWCYTMNPEFRWEYCNFPSCSELNNICGKTLMNLAGVITSPDLDGDGKYEDMMECYWIIKAVESHVIILQVLEMELERNYFSGKACMDYVKVFDKDTLLETLCQYIPQTRLTARDDMTIIFHSDDTINLSGFTAEYSIRRLEDFSKTACGSTIESSSGEFGYIHEEDLFEGASIDCRWQISHSNSSHVELKIHILQIVRSEDCSRSYLSIYNGFTSSDALLAKLCGNDAPPTIPSSSGTLYIHYYSQEASKGDGFAAVFDTPTKGQLYDYETIVFNNSDTGLFGSPDLDGDGTYENNIKCIWEIYAQRKKIIQMFIFEFYLEEDTWCRFDKMNVYEGAGEKRRELGTFCGTTVPNKFRSSSSVIVVHFSTDSSRNGKGFVAGYSYAEEFAWRQWPDGDYAIPMPVFGCPDQELNNWKHRSIMINYREYSWTLIDGIAANMTIRHNLRHLGSIIKDVFEIRLCVKQRTRAKTSPLSNSYEKWQHQLSESAEWPRGKYDVYKTSDNCPTDTSQLFREKTENPPQHYSFWAAPYPNEGYTTDGVNCFLYDLGQSVLISGIRIKSKGKIIANGNQLSLPAILRSQEKWNFLEHAAWICFQHTEITETYIDVHCLNEPTVLSARYLILKEIQTSGWVLDGLQQGYFTLELFSNKGNTVPTCGQSLGMRDGFIEDFQIWSPSKEINKHPATAARPGDAGWCLQKTESTPFLQVDLLVPTTLEGLQIIPVEVSLGLFINLDIHKYTIEYSNSTLKSTLNERWESSIEFVLYRYFEETFLFESPITARYVRIYSEYYSADDYIRCHKFELIGCLKHGGKTMQCDKSRKSEWFTIRGEPVPLRYLYKNPRGNDVNMSLSTCRHHCEEFDLCSVVMVTQTCKWYEHSQTYSYYWAQSALAGAINLKICPKVNVQAKIVSLYLMSNTTLESLTTLVETPGVIANHEYPLHYLSGELHLWEVIFNETMYVNLVVLNVSFNQNQIVKRSHLGDRLFSDSIDRLYIVNDTFDLEIIFSNEAVEEVQGVIAMYDKDVKRKVSHFKYNSKIIRLIWRTVFHDVAMDSSANGFRIFVYPSETPACSTLGTCLWKTATITSVGFLEEFSALYEETWHMLASARSYISLSFNRFHVGCSIDSSLVVWIAKHMYRTFYNLNKPAENINSLSRELTISLRSFKVDHRITEGFALIYREASKHISPELQLMLTSNDSIEYSGDSYLNIKTICSSYFGKCYVLVPDVTKMFNTTIPSWSNIENRVCKMYGGTLVSLHSKLEQDFVGYILLKEFQYTNNEYTYIGLVRELSFVMVHKWTDGSPVTFLSWEEDNPSPDLRYQCTRMSLPLSEDHAWESTLCNAATAMVGVCQYEWKSEAANITTVDIAKPQDLAPTWKSSVFFVCSNMEVISFLGRCNNVTECSDGSDELNCITTFDDCTTVQFRCGDGKCVSITLACDYQQDCTDGSDENCYFPPCGAGEFQCSNQVCINVTQRCDGKTDCDDRSDEEHCVVSNCNDGNSFRCGFSHCIPTTYVCDGVFDCTGREDEQDCLYPNNCQQWWQSGYQETGVYTIYGLQAECDFDSLREKGLIVTKFHNFDIEQSLTGVADMSFKYNHINGLKALIEESKCFQSLDQLCQPWIQLLYDFDEDIVKDQTSTDWSWDYIHVCTCLKYITPLSANFSSSIHRGTLQDCTGRDFEQYIDYYFHFDVSRGESHGHIEVLKLKQGHSFDVNQMTIQANPISCYSEFDTSIPKLACGHGFSTSQANKCLYKLDNHGHIEGCRSLKHLQNCDLFQCPENFFKCPRHFCIDTRFVCDGIPQCLRGEDEQNCENRTCVFQYRCLESEICLPELYICDGIRHCPKGDDEKLCDFRCPEVCSCDGLSVDCSSITTEYNSLLHIAPSTRLLDVSKSPNILQYLILDKSSVHYLMHWNLSYCEIRNISVDIISFMRNLRILDLSHNLLKVIHSKTFNHQSRLHLLKLDGNERMLTIGSEAFFGLTSLKSLKLIHLQIERLSKSSFASLHMQRLEIYQSFIKHAEEFAMEQLHVQEIYLNTTTIELVSDNMFDGIMSLDLLVTDEFALCCIKPSALPAENCFPQSDAFSSCSDLMRNEVLRSLCWVISVFAIFGNSFSFIYNVIFQKANNKLGFGMFVSNLAVSDFLMGIYLIIIAGADMYYRGEYSGYAKSWRNGYLCNFAGTISTLSSEVSLFFIALITLDRYIVVKFPFGNFRIDEKLPKILSAIAWAIGIILSLIPFVFTSYFKHQFYSNAGVCLALPLTNEKVPGWIYSVFLFIVLNFLLTLLIILGQWMIYHEVVSAQATLTKHISGRRNDLKIARNLLLVALTDLLCWFPVTILGLLALTKVVNIPAEVYAWTAVLVLPINAAINPFLYTLNVVIEHKKKKISSKKIIPLTEKTFYKDQVIAWFTIWNKSRFFNVRTDGFVSIAIFFEGERLNLRKCMQIVMGIIKCLYGLHARSLTQHNLAYEDFYIQNKSGRIVVSMNCRPELAKKVKKAKNIHGFGLILSNLLDRCEGQT